MFSSRSGVQTFRTYVPTSTWFLCEKKKDIRKTTAYIIYINKYVDSFYYPPSH